MLIALSIVGIGITDFSPADSYKYWVAMVPIFCGACLILEWSRVRGKGFKWTAILRTQLLHWVGLLVAVRLVFEMLHKGRLDNENTGLVILLLLALSTFIAGIHLGWRLCLVGGFLARPSWRRPTWKSMSGFCSSSGLRCWPLFSCGNTLSAVRMGDEWKNSDGKTTWDDEYEQKIETTDTCSSIFGFVCHSDRFIGFG